MPTAHTTVTVTCRFFGRYAEVLETEALELEVRSDATVADVVAVARRTLARGDLLPERPLVALNREHVALERAVAAGDELAFLPPLAGG